MHSSVQAIFPEFSKRFEGYVHWMYLDIKGLVTTGVGNLIDPEGAALGLPFFDRGTEAPASEAQISTEWRMLKGRPDLAIKGHKACETITRLRLSNSAIDNLVLARLDANEAFLLNTFPEWDDWCADAQLGVLSMAWAMGAGFPKVWPKFREACKARDWRVAAAECRMKEAGNPGVVPRNDADVFLFENAHEVQSRDLDRTRLYYPNRPLPTGGVA